VTGCARRVGALAALTAALVGCGGSHRHLARTSSQAAARPAAGVPSRPAAHVQPGPAAYAIALPLSSKGPTTCTVYEPGTGTQIVFDSEELNVRVECQLWASSQPGDGYLWGYERAAMPDATRVCSLTDPQRKLTASVIEQTEYVPVSAADRAKGRSACASIIAAGWIQQGR
jgi:hypothetical protein